MSFEGPISFDALAAELKKSVVARGILLRAPSWILRSSTWFPFQLSLSQIAAMEGLLLAREKEDSTRDVVSLVSSLSLDRLSPPSQDTAQSKRFVAAWDL